MQRFKEFLSKLKWSKSKKQNHNPVIKIADKATQVSPEFIRRNEFLAKKKRILNRLKVVGTMSLFVQKTKKACELRPEHWNKTTQKMSRNNSLRRGNFLKPDSKWSFQQTSRRRSSIFIRGQVDGRNIVQYFVQSIRNIGCFVGENLIRISSET